MIFIERGMEPEILKTQGKAKTAELCAAHERGESEFDFDGGLYGHATVKDALKDMQHGKCCFCESKLTHICFGDVEHYRPKAGYKQTAREKLKKPGYYWLAYDWNNLLFCCERCNRQYKKNLFPLADAGTRAKTHRDDIAAESPLLINPAELDPKEHIGFREEIPYAIRNSQYGKKTIEILALDREDLNESRRTRLKLLKQLFDLVRLADLRPNDQEFQAEANKARKLLEHFILPEAEYSAMTNSIGYLAT